MNYFQIARSKSLLNKNNYIIEKSKLIKLIITLLLIPLLVNLTIAQPFPKGDPIKGKPCDCQPTPQYPNLPSDNTDKYIKNGSFECYDWFSPYEGYEPPDANIKDYRIYEQFECAIGGITWKSNMEVPLDEERFDYDTVKGWYSPTYYTPNYFNKDDYAGSRMYFNIGRNWLNYHIDDKDNEIFKYRKRYPRGWIMQNGLPNANNSDNYGYAGF
jgi:hypothetical protein